MSELQFESIVNSPLEKVWAFHLDVVTSLPALSPPASEVKLESADVPIKVGTRLTIVAKDPLGRRVRWVAKIVELVPPRTVAFAEEARFVDEQESGPFKSWRHAHEFERIDARTTRVFDYVVYQPPFGPIGWIADKLFIRRSLRSIFEYRRGKLKELLG